MHAEKKQGEKSPDNQQSISKIKTGISSCTNESTPFRMTSPENIQRVAGSNPEGATKPNRTGMPDRLKTGLESLSGYDLSSVRVHYNSPKPRQLGALAYTQGTNIHIGPGQQRHLPHESWHAVQQMQGRVQANKKINGMGLNDNAGLEREADVMGSKALKER
jgi:hypothetical protein